MIIKHIPVTHDGKQIILGTNAPISTIDVAFSTTDTPAELISRLQFVGYYAEESQYGMKLNYDEK